MLHFQYICEKINVMILLSTGFGEGTVYITIALILLLLILVFYKRMVSFVIDLFNRLKEKESLN